MQTITSLRAVPLLGLLAFGCSSSTSSHCSSLSTCCHSANYPATDLPLCEQVVSQNVDSTCAMILSEYEPLGVCSNDAGTGYSCTYTSTTGVPSCMSTSTQSATFEADCSIGASGTFNNGPCPSASLVGCCATTSGSTIDKTCEYSGSASSLASTCTTSGGSWTTSP